MVDKSSEIAATVSNVSMGYIQVLVTQKNHNTVDLKRQNWDPKTVKIAGPQEQRSSKDAGP